MRYQKWIFPCSNNYLTAGRTTAGNWRASVNALSETGVPYSISGLSQDDNLLEPQARPPCQGVSEK